jgi:hypothetical protein
MDHTPTCRKLVEHPINERLGHGGFRIERKDQPPSRSRGGCGEVSSPPHVPLSDEFASTERMSLQGLIDNNVIVVEFEAGDRGESTPDSVFTGGGRTMKEDKDHGEG